MRTERLFAILEYLRARRYPVSAETLAAAFGISVRTIYRDIATMQGMGAPIRGESGIGYQMEDGYFLPPLSFDEDETDAVILGMRLVAARGDRTLKEAAAKVLAKIEAVLLNDERFPDREKRFGAHSRSSDETSNALAPLAVLRRGIRERMRLEMVYLDLKGNRSERVVRPLALTVFDSSWLFTAWCEARTDFRNFRVDLIQELQETGVSFPVEAGREYRDYLRTL